VDGLVLDCSNEEGLEFLVGVVGCEEMNEFMTETLLLQPETRDM
jgi:hypothetical protein